MKKRISSLLSLLLCLALLCSAALPAFAGQKANAQTTAVYNPFETVTVDESAPAASRFLSVMKQVFAKCLNILSNFLINTVVGGSLSALIPNSAAVQRYEDFDLDAYGNFYAGHETFLTAPAAGAGWSLGYAQASILPADLAEKGYAKGAYMPYIFCNEMYQDDEGNYEDLRVRTVAVDDGSGRGTVIFMALDAMGLANADVRQIRAALADFAAAQNIVSINVSCTHIHTGIDSQGVWTDPLATGVGNIFRKDVVYGVDRGFLQAVIDGAVQSATAAVADMKAGRLYYSSMDISNYVWDRTPPTSLDPTLYKLEFVPDDASAAPTILATFGCHPESASYDWDNAVDENGKRGFDKKLSADFVWTMEKVINAAGFNFIFLQGNVCTVTSRRSDSNDGLDTDAHSTAMRYGYEMGYIILGMNMTEAERISLNAATGDRLGVEAHREEEDYTVWYEGLATVAAREVPPLLNIAHRQFICPVDNKLMTIIAKTAVADNLVLQDKWGRYYTVTEVGYMELGDAFNAYLSPGETFTELLKGGDGLKGFPYASIRETLGENTIIFDLMNDAAGYVANDANFVMVGVQYNEDSGDLASDTWCIISYGSRAGSTFIGNLYTLVEEKKAA